VTSHFFISTTFVAVLTCLFSAAVVYFSVSAHVLP
jgi:hypothetical protein